MTNDNLSLCQSLLRQTNSIDHTAELMASDVLEYGTIGFSHATSSWRLAIIREVERGNLII